MRKTISLTLILAWALNGLSQPNIAEFESFINDQYRLFDLPAMSVCIVKDGGVLVNAQFGMRGEDDRNPPDQNTLYGIASLTKAFTVAAIGMLIDEGKLKWDDKVIDHLPWFEMHDPYVTRNMTIEDLLCHRSGLITFDGDLLWYGTTYSREDAVKRIKNRPLTHGFRAEFGYQNLMYMTAGEVIEEVSGMSWDDFIALRILKPLGMSRTTSSFQAFSTDFNIAKPHLKGEEIFMLSYDNSGATAALNSSSNDMSKWMKFWLNHGVVESKALLSEESIDKIWSLHTPLSVGAFDEQNGTHFKGYGLGWFLMDFNGQKVVHHGGGLPGYISKVALVPEQNLGIVVLTNDMSTVPSMLMYAAIDWAMGKPYEQWSETFYEFKLKGEERDRKQEEERLKTRIPEPRVLPLEDYLGIYEDIMYGKAEISMGQEGLIISLLPAPELFTGKLEPWAHHAFKFEVNDPFLPYGIVQFQVEQDVIKGFTIDLPNDDFHFDKLKFVKQ